MNNQKARQVRTIYSRLLECYTRGDAPSTVDGLTRLDGEQRVALIEELERDQADDPDAAGFVEQVKAAFDGVPQNAPGKPAGAEPAKARVGAPPAEIRMGDRDKPDYGQYTVHPVADLFPLIGGDEFNRLVDDIKANGLLEPVVLTHDGGTIADGRNRYRACKAAGVEPTFTKLAESVQVVAFIVSKNLQRRHLGTGERTALAAKMLPHLKEEAKARRKVGADNLKRGQSPGPRKFALTGPPSVAQKEVASGKATERAAKLAGVSTRSVEQFIKIEKEDPALAGRIGTGQTSINAATQRIKERQGNQHKKPRKRKPTFDYEVGSDGKMHKVDEAPDEELARLEAETELVAAWLGSTWTNLLAEATTWDEDGRPDSE